MAKVNEATIEHLKRWEGLRLEAYPDPGSRNGHPWTIGYGHTSDSKMKVTPGLRITEKEADELLAWDAGEAASAVDRLVAVPLTDNQRGALVSFVLNIGEDEFRGSTLLRKLNAGEYDAVPAQLARWIYNDGKKMDGLVNRRAAEAGLWSRESFVASRNVAAAPPKEKTPWAKPETLVQILPGLGGLSFLATGDGPVQWAVGGALVIAAVVAAWLIIRSSAR